MDKAWKKTRKLLSDSSGIPEKIIDYRASHQVITLYIHGKGLKTIQRTLNLSFKCVKEVILECFGEIIHFKDLNYSPYNTNSNEYLDMCAEYDTIMEEVESYE